MKSTKIAINGFGRIGRNAFKVAFGRPDIEIVAINDLGNIEVLAHLLKYDSTYGMYHPEIEVKKDKLLVDGKGIIFKSESDIEKLGWGDLGVDVVLECTGRFTDKDSAQKHITKSGAKKVILSAPTKSDEIKTIVMGVNEAKIALEDDVISNASCTTNCIAPVMAILDEVFGVDKGMMTTIHAYTATQSLLDGPAKDFRTARSAAENIIPTTTGASKALSQVLPAFDGNFGGLSIRVPVPVVSMSDFSILLKRDTTIDELNETFKKAAREPYYQGIFTVTEKELVSSDFIGNPASSIVDLKLTSIVGGNLVKVVAWYDNEWGYSNRLVELAVEVGKLLNRKGKK